MSNQLHIQIVESPDHAPNYRMDNPEIKAAEIGKVIVVKRGTVGGNATVDFQIQDKHGNQFVAMLTGKLVRAIAAAVEGAESP